MIRFTNQSKDLWLFKQSWDRKNSHVWIPNFMNIPLYHSSSVKRQKSKCRNIMLMLSIYVWLLLLFCWWCLLCLFVVNWLRKEKAISRTSRSIHQVSGQAWWEVHRYPGHVQGLFTEGSSTWCWRMTVQIYPCVSEPDQNRTGRDFR